ncbi:hypothetical protein D3C80_1244040 [compost metagenome]
MQLTISIHTTIALLEHHQRPGNIEVDQPMSLVVQVKTFGGHIRGNQQAQGRMGFSEIFDRLLDILVRQLAVQDGYGVIF